MNRIPNYLYHYTSLDNFKKIFQSKSIRLYNAFTQESDDKEIYYAGNYFTTEYQEGLKKILANNEKQINHSAYFLVMYITTCLFFCDHKPAKDELKILMNNLENENKFKEIYEIFVANPVTFYLSCFSNNSKNNYLWKNYAKNFNGVCFKVSQNNIRAGKKIINYLSDNDLAYAIESFLKTKKDGFDNLPLSEQISIIMPTLTDWALSTKREKYVQEDEIRICDHTHSYGTKLLNNQNICEFTGKYYVNAKLNKSLLKNDLKIIYYHHKIQEEFKQKLFEFTSENKITTIEI